MDTLGSHFDALRVEMRGEVSNVLATIREVEAQRSIDYNNMATTLKDVPTTKTMWKIGGVVFGGLIGLLALLWTVLGIGASMTGSLAGHVVDVKQIQAQQQQQAIEIKNDIRGLRQEISNENAERGAGNGSAGAVHQGTRAATKPGG